LFIGTKEIEEGKLKRESDIILQGEKSLKSSIKINDYEIRSREKANNSRPLDLVKLHKR
jgi:hypothetical protein